MSQNVKEESIVEVERLRPMLQMYNENLGQYINDNERYKLGRILTIIDASFTDPEQRKAVKDLVNNEWWGNTSQLRPSNSPMANPHTELRGLTIACGFELYPPNNSGERRPARDEQSDRNATYATERYIKVATK